jgi:hypothetical protein
MHLSRFARTTDRPRVDIWCPASAGCQTDAAANGGAQFGLITTSAAIATGAHTALLGVLAPADLLRSVLSAPGTSSRGNDPPSLPPAGGPVGRLLESWHAAVAAMTDGGAGPSRPSHAGWVALRSPHRQAGRRGERHHVSGADRS